ncbi:bifunctional riboflavin kinase/FAD synthetase [Kribbia dieselivorans]|uniref:bifunctional riboflavin kinase/FAD synthetase n=1 Tax=Kribbia dieselivorans TaxID=331526 RepID=UPI000838C93F|nr:bifunctional riboflavin kinase/FAD synthetase [Kribbia dieselivorans]
MHRWTDPSQTPAGLKPCVATFGNFDGVHRGHQAVLDAVKTAARERDLPAVVVTFEPHPVRVLHPERAPELISPGVLRDHLIEETGVDGLLVLEFTREFAQLSAEDYIRSVFVDGLGIAALVVGQDTRGFGAGYTGDVDQLHELGARYGFDVIVLPDQGDNERWSSSMIRGHLRDGEVDKAAEILGRPHRVLGTVVHGLQRGRDLGFPTANLSQSSTGVVPADGVYAGWFERLDLPLDAPDRRLPAAISVGLNPTFADLTKVVVEAYVLDRTDLNLYGETVAVDFVAWVRPNQRFDSLDELIAAIGRDVDECRRILLGE